MGKMGNFIETKKRLTHDPLGDTVSSNIILFLTRFNLKKWYNNNSNLMNLSESESSHSHGTDNHNYYEKKVLKMALQRKDTLCLNFCHINEFNEVIKKVKIQQI